MSPQSLALPRLFFEHIRTGAVRREDSYAFLGSSQPRSRLGLSMLAGAIGGSLKRQGTKGLAERVNRVRPDKDHYEGLETLVAAGRPQR